MPRTTTSSLRPLQLASIAIGAGLLWMFYPLSPVGLGVLVGVSMIPAHYDGLRHSGRFDFERFASEQGVGLVVGWVAMAFVVTTPAAVALTSIGALVLPAELPTVRFLALCTLALLPTVFLGYRLVVRLNPEYRVEGDVA